MRKLLLLLLPACASAALVHAYPRSDLPSVSFEYKDWQLACDNTRTCRAAGYTADDRRPQATLLLSRTAGPRQALQAQLQLAASQGQTALPGAVDMSIGGKALGSVRIERRSRTGVLSPAQVTALLPALLGSGAIAWTRDKTSWTISTTGATAVLLKMDEFQGRLDTPGALVRKGSRSEAAVLPALPVPVIHAGPVTQGDAPMRLSPHTRQAIFTALRPTVAGQDCDVLTAPDPQRDRLEVRAFAAGKLLISHRCWSGAYNEGKGYWVADAQPPYDPVLVTNKGSTYAKGSIVSTQLGRGVGDCAARATWTWDGRSFAQTSDLTTGMCRGIKAGGAWDLPTLVTKIQRRGK